MTDSNVTPIKKEAEEQLPLLAEVGATGLEHYSGIISEEWHPKLQGHMAIRIYREMMDNDPIIGATFYIIELLLRGTNFQIKPADDSPLAKEIADFIESAFWDFKWSSFNSEMLSMLGFGWSWHEKLFKFRKGMRHELPQLKSKENDGRIGWRGFPVRSQDSFVRWEMLDNGTVTGYTQATTPTFRDMTIPRAKSLHFRLRRFKDNPEGYSLLRPIYTPYYFKKNHWFFESVGVERDLAGYPVMEVPAEIMHPNADSDKRAIRSLYESMVKKIKRDQYEGVVIPAEIGRDGKPTGYKLRLMNSGGRRPVDVDVIIKRWDSRTAMALISEFLLLGQQTVGSFALHSDKTHLFSVGLGTILDARDEQFNDDAIPELVMLNGWPSELSPSIEHGDVEKVNLVELANYVTSLSGSGALVTDDDLEDHLRDMGSLPSAQRLPGVPRPVPLPPSPGPGGQFGFPGF